MKARELLVAFGLTILGFLIAVVATWYTSRSLAAQDADWEREAADATVKGAALVLQGILASGDNLFVNSLVDCQYRLYSPEIGIPFEDRKRLAARMPPQEWKEVEQGMESYRLQSVRALEEHEFVFDDVRQIRHARKQMHEAQGALSSLAGLEARKQEPEVLGDECQRSSE